MKAYEKEQKMLRNERIAATEKDLSFSIHGIDLDSVQEKTIFHAKS